ncbi:hemin uptake protein HemP, partial [Escherichia sp. TWPC-MK]
MEIRRIGCGEEYLLRKTQAGKLLLT